MSLTIKPQNNYKLKIKHRNMKKIYIIRKKKITIAAFVFCTYRVESQNSNKT